ncbi:MAG: DUF3300 domain-containing protein [Acidobacteriaceae bacterium]
MISKMTHQVLSMSLCAILLVQGVAAQTSPQPSSTAAPAVAPLTTDQLDSLVAPIALYPDALVAQVLAASCFADEVAFADDWLNQNQNLQGAALTQAVDQQSWDPSVKALTQFPSVLHNLAKNLSWTSNLGQAFTNQQSDVMAAVQVMRAKAQAAGTLQSSSQIKVVQQGAQTIVIEPADSNVVYVPQYNPAVVYGTPLVVPAYTPPIAVASGISFGAGVAIGAAIGGGGGFVAGGFGGGWGFGAWGMNWGGGGGGGNINYNHNTYVNKTTINRNSNNNNNNGNRNNNNGNRDNGNNAGNRNNGDRPGVPNGGRNGNHGLIGGNGGVQHQPLNSNRANVANANRPRSAMSGNGNQARAEANRGRASMRPASYQRQQRAGQQRQQHVNQPRQQHFNQPRGGGERGGGRR